MSMTLSEMERTLCVGHGAWSQVLITAYENGWKPMGTLPPVYDQDSPDWSGNYTSSDSQLVIEEDATNLADALERALPDIYDDEARAFFEDMIAFCREGGFRLY
jgi:Leu/Phe-tRNA-protein transferase